MLTITHGGKTFANFTRAELEAAGVPEDEIAAAEAKALALAKRDHMRAVISAGAGDTQSILGTVCDGSQLILLQLARLAHSLSGATALAEVRAAAQPLADLTEDFLAKVESGEVKLTVTVKGEANVIQEIESRSTAVTNVITGAAQ